MALPFSTLAPTGNGLLTTTLGRTINWPDGRVMAVSIDDVYTPVSADVAGAFALAYRGHQTDQVLLATSGGWEAVIAPRCEGKAPIGIVPLGGALALVVWIPPGAGFARVETATIDVSRRSITPGPSVPITPTQVILGVDLVGAEVRILGQVDGDVTIERAGLTKRLLYARAYNGRVVGADADPGAPNRLVLADGRGWYTVVTSDQSVQFPPQLDGAGNVAFFPGDWRSIDQIHQSPIVVDSGPSSPVPQPTPVPAGVPTYTISPDGRVTPIGVTTAPTSVPAVAILIVLGTVAAVALTRSDG